MSLFTKLLVAPTLAELDAALSAAGDVLVRLAGDADFTPTSDDRAALMKDLGTQAEGVKSLPVPREWHGDCLVVAWWTDALGRRHVRVACGPPPHREHSWPLRLLYPESFCYRRAGTEAWRLLAVCGCGATGRPDELSWLGPWCGPCHDRSEELGPGGVPPARQMVLRLADTPVRRLRWLRDGRRLVVLDSRGTLHVWYPELGTVVMPPLKTGVVAVGVGGEGLFAFTRGNELWHHHLGDGRTRPVLRRQLLDPPFAVCPKGRTAVVGLRHHGVTMWDLSSERRLRPQCITQEPTKRAVFSPCGRRVVLVNDASLLMWDLGKKRAEQWQTSHGGLMGVAFSPDGKFLIASRMEGGVIVWDAASLRKVGETGRASGLCGPVEMTASADGRLMLVAADHAALRVLSVPGLRETCGLAWHETWVECLAVSPDGYWLASGDASGVVRLWPVKALLAC
jgi:hypothetical protein